MFEMILHVGKQGQFEADDHDPDCDDIPFVVLADGDPEQASAPKDE